MGFLDLPIISLLFKNGRTIEEISGFITISETTKDELEITQQPVQEGAMITDHAFSKPTSLSMQIQFDRTNTLAALASTAGSIAGGAAVGILGAVGGGIAGGLVGGLVSGAFGGDVLAQTYEKLLKLQATRVPFDIATPKRVYKSMLFQTLGVVTDKNTENVLSVSCTFQQVILVKVQRAVVDRSLQAQPQRTQATEAVGNKSALRVFFGV